ncbi:helix-turn-helix domain-containing protein [Streptomyces alkaliphilus]|uniref:helix-turn-helix domain-containing protein n=1 Tax=Streptomyces alkaliphilus TaxID=1472722 RepID=UPI0034D1C588
MAVHGGEPEPPEELKAFGAVLKVFRQRAGLTQEELAPLVGFSRETVQSVEVGRRRPQQHFVRQAEEVLDAFGALEAAARHIAPRRGLARWFHQWAALEQEATTLWTYECRLIPGLLQTEAYTRAVALAVPPPPTEEELEQRLTARAERQQLLRRTPPVAFHFLIEQCLFERHTGGEEVTAELIDHLLACTELWNVEVQIMPTRQPHHAGLDGPMRLVETPDHQWLGYVEGQQTGQLISDAKDLSLMHLRYAKMRSQALGPEESVTLLRRMRGDG